MLAAGFRLSLKGEKRKKGRAIGLAYYACGGYARAEGTQLIAPQ